MAEKLREKQILRIADLRERRPGIHAPNASNMIRRVAGSVLTLLRPTVSGDNNEESDIVGEQSRRQCGDKNEQHRYSSLGGHQRNQVLAEMMQKAGELPPLW